MCELCEYDFKSSLFYYKTFIYSLCLHHKLWLRFNLGLLRPCMNLSIGYKGFEPVSSTIEYFMNLLDNNFLLCVRQNCYGLWLYLFNDFEQSTILMVTGLENMYISQECSNISHHFYVFLYFKDHNFPPNFPGRSFLISTFFPPWVSYRQPNKIIA